MQNVPEEIRQQIHEASVDAEVQVCFSRSLIPDFNLDQIDLIESALEEKRLEEIQQGSPLTKRSHRKYQIDIYSFSNNTQKYLEKNNGTL